MAQTSHQVKRAFLKRGGLARPSEKEMRQIARAAELERRAESIKAKERMKRRNKEKRETKEAKERSERYRLGRPEPAKGYFSPRQTRIGNFLGHKSVKQGCGGHTEDGLQNVEAEDADVKHTLPPVLEDGEKPSQEPAALCQASIALTRTPLQSLDTNTCHSREVFHVIKKHSSPIPIDTEEALEALLENASQSEHEMSLTPCANKSAVSTSVQKCARTVTHSSALGALQDPNTRPARVQQFSSPLGADTLQYRGSILAASASNPCDLDIAYFLNGISTQDWGDCGSSQNLPRDTGNQQHEEIITVTGDSSDYGELPSTQELKEIERKIAVNSIPYKGSVVPPVSVLINQDPPQVGATESFDYGEFPLSSQDFAELGV